MLERQVMIEDKLYNYHELDQINILINEAVVPLVHSWTDDDQEGVYSHHVLPWNDNVVVDQVEAQVWTLPFFDTYVNINEKLDEVLDILTDDQAITVPDAFRKWRVGIEYKVGDRCRDDDSLYKCVQAHTSQEGWEPHATPALWVAIAEPGTIPEWVQPAGAHDAYNTGDHVMHNGSEWVSTIDANVYEPGVYGWDEVGSE